MKSFTAITLLAVLASTVSAQGSSGCDENYSGTFEIAPYNITQTIPSQGETVCTTNPIVTLKNGVLTDQEGRTGEVVANHQFQFDKPVQGPTTSGFSVCTNGSLALNGNALFFGCLSGTFSNLYDISIGAQCHQIYIVTFPCQGSGATPIASTPGTTSTTSSTSSTSSSTSTSTTSTFSTSTTPLPVAPPATSTTVTPAPFPVGNSTTVPATASMASTASSSSSSSSSSSTSSTSSTTAPATTFKGAASTVIVGGKVIAVVAGIAAFALF
ncbi:hypothetical protein HO173_011560 [Letharia columbiana]|uniref:Cell wall mannoprotein PIR1-like C-terminal domain-containing protein n=1 Tax=Letharia columbiana TaxID=112416 RepID=A0A8H6FJ84_9LECA|nr:uncharacterized protein HO173_011560 [Letharia columbiana]KAF6229520.1 hypothetical protein HO173_011560 [Letharia columbiana]